MTPQVAEAIVDANRILDSAEQMIHDRGLELRARVVLFSGGNDSTTLFHLVKHRVDYVAHVNTTIGVEKTREHVRRTAQAFEVPLLERYPEFTYEQLVTGQAMQLTNPNKPIWQGFPGPAAHKVMYIWLKDRPLRKVRDMFIEQPRKQRVLFIAGTRLSESQRRQRNVTEIDEEGSIVWCSPLAHWDKLTLGAYREEFEVPRNEVSDLIHMSGECLCGSFAHPGELDELTFWFPDTAAEIRRLEREVTARGITTNRWGVKPPSSRMTAAGRLCADCVVA